MRKFCLLLFLLFGTCGYAQDTLSYAQQLAILEKEMDSLSIFNLIDSLLFMDPASNSEIITRVGYSTNVTSAGRNYGINQTAWSPGISYYHKSGFYADLTGFWNSGSDPAYNPTILSGGYLGYFKNQKWNYAIDAERWIYNPADSSENSLYYSIGSSLSYDFKYGYASMDYSFLFGQETAHRIIPNLTFTIALGKFWIFKSVNLYPSVSMMMGTSDITQLRVTSQQISEQTADRIKLITNFSSLTDDQRMFLSRLINRSYRNGTIDQETRNRLLINLRHSENLSPENRDALSDIVDNGFTVSEYIDTDAFGILNYSFSLPLSLQIERFNILLNYTYSIPIQLPGEFVEVDPIGFFGATLSYRITF